MKTIENKTTSIPKTADEMATYSDLLAIQINQPLKQNVTIKEMRRDIKLLDTLEAAKETIEVSDEDLTYIKSLVENSQWHFKHTDILDFAEYIESIA